MVTDDDGATNNDDVQVTVNAATVNQIPVANAGSDIIITLPTNSANITGSGSDADGFYCFISMDKSYRTNSLHWVWPLMLLFP
jgi:hypothetical protein